ncbi:MAG: dethiobiotin synthase [Solirubrobacterales bacterium]
MRGVFVTGTGTEVGKTIVAAVLARTLAASGKAVAVFKPAVTGLDDEGETDHALLRRAAGSAQSDEEIAPYRYGPPASPHLAAEMDGEQIDPERLLSAARSAAASAGTLVCEGVGGLLVPLRAGRVCTPIGDKVDPPEKAEPPYLVRDLAVDLGLPLAIAASPELGTINHTLLTLEAARAAGLDVVAVVLTPWPSQPSRLEESNRETIEALGDVRVETLPALDLADPGSWPALPLPLAG